MLIHPCHALNPVIGGVHFFQITDAEMMPATLCPEIMIGLLRYKLGFNGMVVTDASHMVGMTNKMKRADMLPAAINAGCDMFLFFNDPAEDFDTMLNAYTTGIISEDRMTEALTRIIGLKAAMGLNKKPGTELYGTDEELAAAMNNAEYNAYSGRLRKLPMKNKTSYTAGELRYLRLLSKQYPTLQAASNEAIRLEAILNLPKGTEHFMSDIHGEHEAFLHILNSSSGEVKEKLNEFFAMQMSARDRNDLATLIYYPEAKLNMVVQTEENLDEWYRLTIHELVQFCRFVSVKHTRAKVRTYIPEGYEQLIDVLINLCDEEENHVIDQLTESFRQSEKLQRHARFLYSKGSLYKVQNGNLLLHSCVPMTEDGKLLSFTIGGKERSGREFMDYADRTARKAYYDKRGTPERLFGMDFLWWLWAGRNSPIFGRDRMTTFERQFIKDESTWTEPKNAYYSYYNDPAVCDMLLKEFGLEGPH